LETLWIEIVTKITVF